MPFPYSADNSDSLCSVRQLRPRPVGISRLLKLLLIYLEFRLNVRQQHNADLKFPNSQELMPFSAIVFGTALPDSSIRSRSRHDSSHLNVNVNLESERHPGITRTNASSDLESEYDMEAQGKKAQGEKDLFSPYFSPLENRKQMLLHVQEPEELHRKGVFDFWKGWYTPAFLVGCQLIYHV